MLESNCHGAVTLSMSVGYWLGTTVDEVAERRMGMGLCVYFVGKHPVIFGRPGVNISNSRLSSLATLNTLLGTVSGEVNAAERARPVSSEVLFVGATLHSDPWVR